MFIPYVICNYATFSVTMEPYKETSSLPSSFRSPSVTVLPVFFETQESLINTTKRLMHVCVYFILYFFLSQENFLSFPRWGNNSSTCSWPELNLGSFDPQANTIHSNKPARALKVLLEAFWLTCFTYTFLFV